MKQAISLLFLLLVSSSLSVAQSRTAGDLRDACKVEDKLHSEDRNPSCGISCLADQGPDRMSLGVCYGYMTGVMNATTSFLIRPDNGGVYEMELQDNVTAGQAAHVFVNYINQHPEEENESMFTAVFNALTSTKLLRMHLTDPVKVCGPGPMKK
jgi:hypothetical protein